MCRHDAGKTLPHPVDLARVRAHSQSCLPPHAFPNCATASRCSVTPARYAAALSLDLPGLRAFPLASGSGPRSAALRP